MSTKKLILLNIVIFFTMINTYLLYFGAGLGPASATKGYLSVIFGGFLTITLLYIVSCLVSYSYFVKKALHRKNLIRVPLLIVSIMFILSVIGRIKELSLGIVCLPCWLNTVLYLVLLIIIYFISKDLYNLIKKLFDE